MRIEHVAIWVDDLEGMKQFYTRAFEGTASERYDNPARGFSSYFVYYDGSARLELMRMPGIAADETRRQLRGLSHLAFAAGSARAVEELTERLVGGGAPLLSAPRLTGDGYYESVVLDPEGNRIEITI
ncbi:VOC family protein [Chitinimonas koreensis]|uniref:VOC family protein n=1 Tax=Chitinimonas koreensis TaxID=356302 RepID=UPI00048E2D59|nr:VOC family protein [Chitinimonas koreensis]QNM96019.1 VOC family protein [Chitinimonas koreensis]